jgi:hypothetical protein
MQKINSGCGCRIRLDIHGIYVIQIVTGLRIRGAKAGALLTVMHRMIDYYKKQYFKRIKEKDFYNE